MRSVADADRHLYSYSHGVGDTDSDTYTDSNPNSDSHGYCNDASSYSDAHRKGHSDSKASSDAAAKAVKANSEHFSIVVVRSPCTTLPPHNLTASILQIAALNELPHPSIACRRYRALRTAAKPGCQW